MAEFVIHFDGACEPNPGGTASYGWVLSGWSDAVGPPSERGLVGTGEGMTNNVAEYVALGKALRWLADRGGLAPDDWLVIKGDSKLVIEQLAGRWRCNVPRLVELRGRCVALLKQIGSRWSAVWVPREENAEADALSVKAWEEATGKPFPHRHARAETTPGKAAPPAEEETEKEVERVMGLMERGLSACCEAPLDTSRVIDRPGHRHHGHGPRYCSKCKKPVYVV